jgi:hypothetical protein
VACEVDPDALDRFGAMMMMGVEKGLIFMKKFWFFCWKFG